MSLLKDERGQFAYAIIFAFILMIFIFFFAIVAPMLQLQATEYYGAGERIIDKTNANAAGIQDAGVREAITGSTQATKDSYSFQIETYGALATYGIFFIIFIVLMTLFLLGRRNIETGSIG